MPAREESRSAANAGRRSTVGYEFPGHDSFGLLLRIATAGFRQSFKEQLAEYGIPLNIWYYLRVLWENDGLSQKELTQRVGILQPNAVGAIQSMKRLGLVRIERSSPDLRRLCICLSPKARALQRELLPKVRRKIETVAFKGFDERERRQLVTLLERVCVNVSEARAGRPG
jgi:DNA-binding MarR family transcriptional regulator